MDVEAAGISLVSIEECLKERVANWQAVVRAERGMLGVEEEGDSAFHLTMVRDHD